MKKLFLGFYIMAVLFIIFGVIGSVTGMFDEDEPETQEKEPETEEVVQQEEEPNEEPAPEESREDDIEVTTRVLAAGYEDVSLSDIRINEDAGTGEGYIVLADLSFDGKNWAKTTKEKINEYSNDLGARLADEEDVNEVTVFWKVPYLQETGNIAKYNMQRQGDKMQIKEEHFDPNIFK